MLQVYQFDDKYATDTDGFTFNLKAWLGDADAIASVPQATLTPNDAGVVSVEVAGVLVTVWIDGGTGGQSYVLEIEVITTAGRNCRIRGTFGVET